MITVAVDTNTRARTYQNEAGCLVARCSRSLTGPGTWDVWLYFGPDISDRLSSLLEDIAERMCLNHGGLLGLEEPAGWASPRTRVRSSRRAKGAFSWSSSCSTMS